ncbi:hypothetical protein CFP65_2676 [Kitasatospora sp. MMS16-BH015]|uniref:hypothetical protein n=1 Tax=Kitasatospora sp. MMS16-BH015 TaxID=2018025 RepID=UPI000CA32BF3|nr:hypothetical protein [Kitasatospora sp. MMS16-BH015]AUG77497.1 hypothetical protein CFP65_2676 [Kitasatospora sp. MMS16-BH015]
MSDGYRVNTDELEAVVKRLRTLQQNVGQTADKSKYNTVASQGDFGGDFTEAHTLFTAHDNMKQFLDDTCLKLNQLIGEFGDKTHTVTTSYRDLEEQGRVTMNAQHPNGRAV